MIGLCSSIYGVGHRQMSSWGEKAPKEALRALSEFSVELRRVLTGAVLNGWAGMDPIEGRSTPGKDWSRG